MNAQTLGHEATAQFELNVGQLFKPDFLEERLCYLLKPNVRQPPIAGCAAGYYVMVMKTEEVCPERFLKLQCTNSRNPVVRSRYKTLVKVLCIDLTLNQDVQQRPKAYNVSFSPSLYWIKRHKEMHADNDIMGMDVSPISTLSFSSYMCGVGEWNEESRNNCIRIPYHLLFQSTDRRSGDETANVLLTVTDKLNPQYVSNIGELCSSDSSDTEESQSLISPSRPPPPVPSTSNVETAESEEYIDSHVLHFISNPQTFRMSPPPASEQNDGGATERPQRCQSAPIPMGIQRVRINGETESEALLAAIALSRLRPSASINLPVPVVEHSERSQQQQQLSQPPPPNSPDSSDTQILHD